MPPYDRPATAILHPTDFSATSELAFAHALAIAIRNKARLTILHVVPDKEQNVPWHDYPSVRKTLEQWGYLEPGSSRSSVAGKLGVNVKKAVGFDKNITKSIVDIANAHDFDLIVMATDENREQPLLKRSQVALPVSQKTHLPTLFVPQDVRGCVVLSDGSTSLNRVLLPVDHQPSAQGVIDRISWAVDKFGGQDSMITLLHVGEASQFPHVTPPDRGNITWSLASRDGEASTEIIKAAEELDVDLIAMVTEGKKGFWDVLTGNTVQRVLRNAPCPVFTMPAVAWSE